MHLLKYCLNNLKLKLLKMLKQVVAQKYNSDCKRDGLWVRLSLDEMKYLIF